MEVLAFIRLIACDQFRPAHGSVESLHPSEDGEALQRIVHGSLPAESGFSAESALPVPTASRWFAVYTNCRHEKRVALHFRERGIEYFLPLYRSERKWRDGSKVTLDLPLFPCYIFVHIDRRDRVRVLSVPGTVAVVGGTGHEPAPLPDSAIAALRSGLEQRNVEPHPLLTVGQRARVRAGAFAGMEGIVVRKKNSFRVVLTLDLIMQSIAVEVAEEDLDPIETDNLVHAGSSSSNSALSLQEA